MIYFTVFLSKLYIDKTKIISLSNFTSKSKEFFSLKYHIQKTMIAHASSRSPCLYYYKIQVFILYVCNLFFARIDFRTTESIVWLDWPLIITIDDMVLEKKKLQKSKRGNSLDPLLNISLQIIRNLKTLKSFLFKGYNR